MNIGNCANIEINKIVPSKKPKKNQHVDKVASSIKEFGFQQPIVVDKDHVIIVGHTKYQTAMKLGMKEVPIIVANNLSENQ